MWTWSRFYVQLKTVAAVTAITVLIWLYAESENVRTHELRLAVEFVPPPNRGLIVKGPTQPLIVQMSFRSTLGQFAQVQKRAQSGPVRYQLSENTDAAGYGETVVLRDWLSGDSPLAGMGINIEEVKPSAVNVMLERREAEPAHDGPGAS